MLSRLELHEILVSVLGSRNVYYQPPESVTMQYPAILYSRSDITNDFADDEVYNQHYSYKIVVIASDPDSEIVEKVSKIKYTKFERHYVANLLNHDVFSLTC